MKKLLTLAAVGVATQLPVLPSAMAAENVVLSAAIEAGKSGDAHLTLVRKQGRYALDEASKIRLSVNLNADVGQGSTGERIVVTELELKDAGGGAPISGIGLAGPSPASAAKAAGDYEFSLDPTGVLAQNAAAACGSASTSNSRHLAKMTVTASWRVTTGRFTFSFVNYDRVAPVEGIKDNPDNYGERQTHVKDVAVPLTLSCIDDAPSAVAQSKPAKSAPNKTAEAKVEPSKAKTKPEPSNPSPAEAKPAQRITVEPDTKTAQLVPASLDDDTSSHAAATAPVCEGGMIRETSVEAGSFICLCPGNTQRITTSANAYSCEKRSRR